MAQKTPAAGGNSTMHDVAVAAGVSTATVSRALRGSDSVRPETAERVRSAAAELGFSVTASAAGLASGKVKRIAVLLGSPLTDWFSGAILDEIYRVLRRAGHDLLLYRVHGAQEREEFFRSLPARRNADALIVASFLLSEQEQAILERIDTPMVYLNHEVPGRPSVGIDDVAAGRQAVQHLHDLGHRRFRFLRAELEPGFVFSASNRYDGFRARLQELGLADEGLDPICVPMEEDFAAELVESLLAGPLPVAVVAEHDELAMRLLLGLWQAGVSVPEQVAVIGFDGQPRAAHFGLSTVSQPVEDLAASAAELALQLARSEADPQEGRRIEFPTEVHADRTTLGNSEAD